LTHSFEPIYLFVTRFFAGSFAQSVFHPWLNSFTDRRMATAAKRAQCAQSIKETAGECKLYPCVLRERGHSHCSIMLQAHRLKRKLSAFSRKRAGVRHFGHF
jgi:hypothetical protein